MFGNGCLMSRFWGLPSFYMRFASMDNPNLYFFNDEGHPNLNTDLGVQCAEEHLRSFEWSPPDALNFTFLEGWNSLWNLQVPQDLYIHRGRQVRRRKEAGRYSEVESNGLDGVPWPGGPQVRRQS